MSRRNTRWIKLLVIKTKKIGVVGAERAGSCSLGNGCGFTPSATGNHLQVWWYR